MKKLLFLPLMAVCFMICGCTAEMESEPSTQSERVNETKLKILEMAEDYGLKVRINDNLTSQDIDKINLDTLDLVMRGLTAIKGTYKLECSRNGNTFRASQQKSNSRRSSRPVVHSYKYEYDTTDISGNGYHFSGDCVLSWDVIDGEIGNAKAECTVSSSELLMGSSGTSLDGNVDEDGVISFSGEVDYNTSWNTGSFSPIIIYFYVSGQYTGESATTYIDWN